LAVATGEAPTPADSAAATDGAAAMGWIAAVVAVGLVPEAVAASPVAGDVAEDEADGASAAGDGLGGTALLGGGPGGPSMVLLAGLDDDVEVSTLAHRAAAVTAGSAAALSSTPV